MEESPVKKFHTLCVFSVRSLLTVFSCAFFFAQMGRICSSSLYLSFGFGRKERKRGKKSRNHPIVATQRSFNTLSLLSSLSVSLSLSVCLYVCLSLWRPPKVIDNVLEYSLVGVLWLLLYREGAPRVSSPSLLRLLRARPVGHGGHWFDRIYVRGRVWAWSWVPM